MLYACMYIHICKKIDLYIHSAVYSSSSIGNSLNHPPNLTINIYIHTYKYTNVNRHVCICTYMLFDYI